jgi:hypothetical protein
LDVNYTQHALAASSRRVETGKEVGLHLVVSRRIAQWGRTQANPLVGEMVKG